ncbi:translation initiation factor IF-2-like [Monodelphis domestica]|uniref:translation initiation factor IF-2-like n=1 Tax=Monodelphis domestica TaxID=13616 RepID=UPI0024E1AB24|nr:translation initiation factor IF-2-like [Monodelphis domestica]
MAAAADGCCCFYLLPPAAAAASSASPSVAAAGRHPLRERDGRPTARPPDSPGRVRGGPGPGSGAPRGGMAAGRGRMAADGAGFGSSRLPRSLGGSAPTNGPSGQPPPPGAPPPPPASLRAGTRPLICIMGGVPATRPHSLISVQVRLKKKKRREGKP